MCWSGSLKIMHEGSIDNRLCCQNNQMWKGEKTLIGLKAEAPKPIMASLQFVPISNFLLPNHGDILRYAC